MGLAIAKLLTLNSERRG